MKIHELLCVQILQIGNFIIMHLAQPEMLLSKVNIIKEGSGKLLQFIIGIKLKNQKSLKSKKICFLLEKQEIKLFWLDCLLN